MLVGASLKRHKVTAGLWSRGWDPSSPAGFRVPLSKAINFKAPDPGYSLSPGVWAELGEVTGREDAEALTEICTQSHRERKRYSNPWGHSQRPGPRHTMRPREKQKQRET